MPGYTHITISTHTSPASVAATATTTQIKLPADTTTPTTSTMHPQLPQQPLTLTHLATPENIPKLEQYLLDQFHDTTFNRSTPFAVMSTKPAHIHLKERAVPHAWHTPMPIPLHWKAQVKAALDQNVEKVIITPVAKKDGTPRRMVDIQHLNNQCLQETHHCQSPFHNWHAKYHQTAIK